MHVHVSERVKGRIGEGEREMRRKEPLRDDNDEIRIGRSGNEQ